MPSHRVLWDGPPDLLRNLLPDEVELVPWSDDPETLATCAALLTYAHPTVDDALLRQMPQLRVISNHGVGVDHIELQAAAERNIPVGNTPGCLDASTADMTFALLLAAARNVVAGDRFAHSAEFTQYEPSRLIGREVTGSTLGIIGLGRIGLQVAQRAAAFEMPILYHNRRRNEQAEQRTAAVWRTLDELLAESDFVSLHCPLTPETVGLINVPQFARMKPSAILVNMARGPVVDQSALYNALTNGEIAGAALDVTDPEPLPRDHELLGLKNLVITPHLGSASDRTRRRMLEMSVQNLLDGLAGRPLSWPVSPVEE